MKKTVLLISICFINLSLLSCKNRNTASIIKVDTSFEVQLKKEYYYYDKLTTTELINLSNEKNNEIIDKYNKCLEEYTFYVDSYEPQRIAVDVYTRYLLIFKDSNNKEVTLLYNHQRFYTGFFDDYTNQSLYIDNSHYKYYNLYNFEQEIVDMFECGNYQTNVIESKL